MSLSKFLCILDFLWSKMTLSGVIYIKSSKSQGKPEVGPRLKYKVGQIPFVL
jgi:hypothetical protein